MIHPLAPMVTQIALTLMTSGNPRYQNRSLDDVIAEVLVNFECIDDYFVEDEVDGTVH